MIEKIQHATASSPEGAKGLVKGVLACAFQNIAQLIFTSQPKMFRNPIIRAQTEK